MERALIIDNFGRNVSVKICPTGVKTSRLRETLDETVCKDRRKELLVEAAGRKILLGLDDFDEFKGIDQKIAAFEHMLEEHPEISEQVVLYQLCNPPRGSNRDIDDLLSTVTEMVERINAKHSKNGNDVVKFEVRPVRCTNASLYSVARIAVVTATRDGMNLAPYEYITCRQGPNDEEQGTADGFALPRQSALIISEFTEVLAVALERAWRQSVARRRHRGYHVQGALHERTRTRGETRSTGDTSANITSVSGRNRVSPSYNASTEKAQSNKCYGLGFGLNFRVVHLSSTFRKLDTSAVVADYLKSSRRKIVVDYDGTLVQLASLARLGKSTHLRLLALLCSWRRRRRQRGVHRLGTRA